MSNELIPFQRNKQVVPRYLVEHNERAMARMEQLAAQGKKAIKLTSDNIEFDHFAKLKTLNTISRLRSAFDFDELSDDMKASLNEPVRKHLHDGTAAVIEVNHRINEIAATLPEDERIGFVERAVRLLTSPT